jgi:tripartite-type tricarboxylate transporter receptor subunit TctC
MDTIIRATLASLILAGNIAAVGSAAAQNYPTKPIRIIVPFPPGGAPDILARMLAQKLTETFKQALVVDNRSGASGVIGTETAVRASPDGYTMLVTSGNHATSAALFKLPFEPVNDVTPILLIGEGTSLVTLYPSVPAKSIKELIAYDKANPGKLTYGSSGTGAYIHLVTELFNHMAGTRVTHVPYKGVSPALNDLLGGQIQLIFSPAASVIPHISTNRLRGIAVTTAKRSSALPDIPTVAETVPGYETVSWYAVFGPKALPKDIAARWNSEINRILQLPDVKERMAGMGMEPAGGSPERLRDVVKRDIAKWQNVVKVANIKAEG